MTAWGYKIPCYESPHWILEVSGAVSGAPCDFPPEIARGDDESSLAGLMLFY
ncbi:hypothetical protein CY34DRAFT_801465 [Suillus luteus UH-Slu-Lm8-n1]|uniref:Uncharacterized protein n=1 Tax=Suillus luteus UH-Slu-Lm8-n1 TaxID=930992 RepID=A0A0D0B6W8_9AGAM|nr:hypothetical protein CY34DRAFT_801465 [Suillus luteus UH-Slu-Lm8-n1]